MIRVVDNSALSEKGTLDSITPRDVLRKSTGKLAAFIHRDNVVIDLSSCMFPLMMLGSISRDQLELGAFLRGGVIAFSCLSCKLTYNASRRQSGGSLLS
jgi:hypothetical protein